MIVIKTDIPVDPDRRAEALDVVETMVERSRTEDGTVEYWAATDVVESNVIRFFERYEDVAAAKAHTGTDHYREFVESLPDLADGELETVQFETDGEPHVSRFDAEEAVRAVPDAE